MDEWISQYTIRILTIDNQDIVVVFILNGEEIIRD
jgi:hypothetical protein